jgi:hypothetical protein
MKTGVSRIWLNSPVNGKINCGIFIRVIGNFDSAPIGVNANIFEYIVLIVRYKVLWSTYGENCLVFVLKFS